MTISYEYHNALYINLTNRCDCSCIFCLRQNSGGGSIYTDNLWLEREPSVPEALDDICSRQLQKYSEIVFCGFGEPTFRIFDIIDICKTLRSKYKETLPKLRINTNGHANLINNQDITSLLHGVIDSLSISLNAPDVEKYVQITRPNAGADAYYSMLDFTRKAAQEIPEVTMTVVDKDLSKEEIDSCRILANSLGAKLRVRAYIAD